MEKSSCRREKTNYIFKSEKGYCPQCIAFGRLYFIQDRYIGGEKYEYALMSKPMNKKNTWKFSDAKKMISFLMDEDITDDIAGNLLINQITVYQCGSNKMMEKDGVKYIWDDCKKELREYSEPTQETGYCSTYLECLNLSKKILKNMEQKSAGIRLSCRC